MNNLTIHTLVALPLHNLNRDAFGMPKTVTEGGVTRARLSSQAIKRAARIAFERETNSATFRSKVQVNSLVEIAIVQAEERGHAVNDKQIAELTKYMTDQVNALTKKASDEPAGKKSSKKAAGAASEDSDAATTPEKGDTLVWLSNTERRALVNTAIEKIVLGNNPGEWLRKGTDHLSLAAFGRMFAAAPDFSLEAAVSVGNAVTTHAATLEADYFTAVDDLATGPGAGQIGEQWFTSGVYYQAITIDRAQLRRNLAYADLNSPDIQAELKVLIRHLITALPKGKKSGTAPFVQPSIVLVEEQAYRNAVAFDKPVQAEDEGYLAPSVKALDEKIVRSRAFEPESFGDTYLTGIDADLSTLDVERGTLAQAIDRIVAWVTA